MDEMILGVLEKGGVVLRQVLNSVEEGPSYWYLMHKVVDNPKYNSQLGRPPPKSFVRITIIAEPVTYDEYKEGLL